MSSPADPGGGPDTVATRGEFARGLTLLREKVGLTVREVAKAIDKPPATVGDYFSGAHLPPLSPPDVLTGLLAVCGVADPAEADRWRRALARARRAPGRQPADAQAPYRGLACFQTEHTEWFFGREALTRSVVRRLARQRLLMVVGPSGSGKSSLLRAGVVPALLSGELGASFGQPVLLTPGATPLRALADRMASVTGVPAAEIYTAIRSDPGGCEALVSRVLVVDQFEEVYTLCHDERERQEFIAALGSLTVVIGLRADFYSHVLKFPSLASAVQDAQVVVGPMTEDELRQAITEPARKAKLDLEDGFVELVLGELASPVTAEAYEAGALPLLSHALLATWELARRGRLTMADYRACGGIAGSIKRTADTVYHDELTPIQRRLARDLFIRLVQVGEDGRDTRRRVSRDELISGREELAEVLDKFVDRRLITVDAEVVAISHEALISAWPLLREWIDADRAGLHAVQLLSDAARVWDRGGRNSADLYRGTRLVAVRNWVEAGRGRELTTPTREFLEASVCWERRRIRRLYQAVAGFAALFLLAATAGVVAFYQGTQADRERELAVSRLLAGRADRVRGTDVSLAAQLSLASYRISPTVEARSSLLDSSASPAVTRLLGATGVVHKVVFTPDGTILATGNSDGTVRLWDVRDQGRPVRLGPPLRGPGESVYAIAFSPDGRILAAAGTGGTVRLWDVRDPRKPVPLGSPITGLGLYTQSVAFSPDGGTLAVVGSEVHLVDLRDPIRPKVRGGPLDGPESLVQSVAFSPDGRTLAAGGDDRKVWLWDVREPERPIIAAEPEGVVYAVAFSPDGRTLAAGSSDRTVRLLDVTDPRHPAPRKVPALTGTKSWVYAVTFSPDGRTVAAACADDTVYLWDADSGRQRARLPHPGPVTAIAYGRDGHTLATGAADGVARLWRLPGPVLTDSDGAVFTVAFSPDGRTLAAAGGDRRVRLWDMSMPRTPTLMGRGLTAGNHLVGTVAYGAGGRLAAGRDDGTVQLWDVADPTRPVALEVPRSGLRRVVESVAFAPSGRLMAAADSDGGVQLWNTADPRRSVPLATLTTTPGKQAFSVAFSPDGRTLAAASADRTVWLWDITDPQRPRRFARRLTGPTNYAYHVAFSPDGRSLAVASADGTVRLWDMTGVPRPLVAPLAGPKGYVYAVAFSPDGRVLATANTDKSVWLWDIGNRSHPRRLALLTGPDGTVFSVAFAADGHTLAVGGQDRTVRIWDIDPEAVADRICATAGDPLTTAEWTQYIGRSYDPPCRDGRSG